jgi:hypothetical protein
MRFHDGYALALIALSAGPACAPIAPSPSKLIALPSSPFSPGASLPSGSHSSLASIFEFLDEGETNTPDQSLVLSALELREWISMGSVRLKASLTIPPTHIVLVLTTREGLGDVSSFQVDFVSLDGDSAWLGVEGPSHLETWSSVSARILFARLQWRT